jgi:DNA replication protein DnaC
VTESIEDAVIEQHTRTLKLPRLRREYQSLAREATTEAWTYEQFLIRLLETELEGRRENTIAERIRQARFPAIKSLDHLDWSALRGVDRAKVMALATAAFIAQAQDVVIAGPVGTGKTHLAIGLGLAAAERCHNVLFVRAADLVRDLQEARDTLTLGRMQRRLQRVELLIIDELGFVPFSATGAELLFNLLSDRHGQRSTVLTTNLAFGEWVQVFGNEKLTTALLDRLCYRAEILVTSGPSYRARANQPGGRPSRDAEAERRKSAPVKRTSPALDTGGSVG